MLGAIAGDIIGSIYETNATKRLDFPLFTKRSRFTDDTVLTVAVAYSILEGVDFTTSLKDFARRYPNAGYGGTFFQWILSANTEPYNSWGNGSAMRVSPIGHAYHNITEVLQQAAHSAAVTHNHPEGIKGAQAAAVAVFLARQGSSKLEIKEYITTHFGYDLARQLDKIRPIYTFDVSCQGSVPESIIAFLESDNYEDAVRKAISLGGDSDTMAAIAGAIAEAYYKEIPDEILMAVRQRLPEEFLQIIEKFYRRYILF